MAPAAAHTSLPFVDVVSYPPPARLSLPTTSAPSFRSSAPSHARSSATGEELKDKEGRPLVDFRMITEGSQQGLRRQLRARHIALISIGGVIGTGLFLGTAQSLAIGGPLSLLLSYIVMGVLVWAMMTALYALSSPRLVDPAFGLACGWAYCANWLLVMPAELSAAATLIGFWSNANPAGWIAICYVLVVLINLGGTRVYGELEFWFASIKIVTIVGLLILSIVITAGGVPGTEPIGFAYYRDPGPFQQFLGISGPVGRFAGFIAVLTRAAYAYMGSEIVSIAAGEARNPSRSLPQAIRRIIFRIGLFYVAGAFAIGLIVAANDPALSRHDGTALSSPFVVLPSIINAALLTSATSAASSGLYTASRCLYGLSVNSLLPPAFARLNSYGLPWVSVLTASAFGLLSFMSAGSRHAAVVFSWLSNFCSVGGIVTWAAICYCYIRWYHAAKAQDIPRNFFPYQAPFQPYSAYIALAGFLLVLLIQGFYLCIDGQWNASDFVTRYLMILLFPLTYLGGRLWLRCETLSLLEIDFFSGSRDNDETPVEKPRTPLKRFLKALV
ncbi:hypothetical protein NBRC10512v2_005801 [Rhodotorula toruloides]